MTCHRRQAATVPIATSLLVSWRFTSPMRAFAALEGARSQALRRLVVERRILAGGPREALARRCGPLPGSRRCRDRCMADLSLAAAEEARARKRPTRELRPTAGRMAMPGPQDVLNRATVAVAARAVGLCGGPYEGRRALARDRGERPAVIRCRCAHAGCGPVPEARHAVHSFRLLADEYVWIPRGFAPVPSGRIRCQSVCVILQRWSRSCGSRPLRPRQARMPSWPLSRRVFTSLFPPDVQVAIPIGPGACNMPRWTSVGTSIPGARDERCRRARLSRRGEGAHLRALAGRAGSVWRRVPANRQPPARRLLRWWWGTLSSRRAAPLRRAARRHPVGRTQSAPLCGAA